MLWRAGTNLLHLLLGKEREKRKKIWRRKGQEMEIKKRARALERSRKNGRKLRGEVSKVGVEEEQE